MLFMRLFQFVWQRGDTFTLIVIDKDFTGLFEECDMVVGATSIDIFSCGFAVYRVKWECMWGRGRGFFF